MDSCIKLLCTCLFFFRTFICDGAEEAATDSKILRAGNGFSKQLPSSLQNWPIYRAQTLSLLTPPVRPVAPALPTGLING